MSIQQQSVEDLIKECRTGNHEAWNVFVDRFHPLIVVVVRRTVRQWRVAPDLVDDLVQAVYLKMYANRDRLLGQFEARHEGAFYGYLKTVATNAVQDQLRTSRAAKRGAGVPSESLGELPSPGTSEQGFHWPIFLDQSEAALLAAGFSHDERVLFWLYYRDGATAVDLSAMETTRLSVKGVESKLRRMSTVLRHRFTPIGGMNACNSVGCPPAARLTRGRHSCRATVVGEKKFAAAFPESRMQVCRPIQTRPVGDTVARG